MNGRVDAVDPAPLLCGQASGSPSSAPPSHSRRPRCVDRPVTGPFWRPRPAIAGVHRMTAIDPLVFTVNPQARPTLGCRGSYPSPIYKSCVRNAQLTRGCTLGEPGDRLEFAPPGVWGVVIHGVADTRISGESPGFESNSYKRTTVKRLRGKPDQTETTKFCLVGGREGLCRLFES